MPKPLATWNPARGVWETNQENLFCGHLAPYSETWPASGTTQNGVAFERATWAPRTDGSESSLLPTPEANTASNGGSQHPDKRRDGGHSVNLQDVAEHLLPTPRVSMANGPSERELAENDPKRRLETTLALLPTPRSQNGEDRNNLIWERPLDEPQNLENALARLPLLPTPRASDGPGAAAHNRTWSYTDRSLHTLVHNGELTAQPSNDGND